MEPILSAYCQQWIEQYQQLSNQRKLIDEALEALKSLIIANGGVIPGTSAVEKAKIVEIPPMAVAVKEPDYDTRGSWAYKIEYVLGTEKGKRAPMPVLDIASYINNLEPELDLNKIIKAVTMEASKMGLNGKLGIRKKGNKNFYFVEKQLGLNLHIDTEDNIS